MKINETVSYGGASPDQAFDLICDEQFRAEVCDLLHAVDYEVTVERDDDTADITIRRVMPTDMPDFVKKLVGDTVEVLQTERWGAADATGTRRADIEVHIKGQPASMTGTGSIGASADGGAELTVVGDVTVKIPFLGKKIEPEVAKAIVAAVRAEAEEGIRRLG